MPKESKSDEVLMSKEGVEENGVKTPKVSRTKPKTLKKDLEACRRDYEAGNYRSIVELASRYGLNHFTLKARLTREKWAPTKIENLTKLNSRIEEKVVDLASEYLKSSFLRSQKYTGLIDASIEQNATDPTGRYVVAPSDLDAYTRSENRIHELALSALRLPRTVSVDLTSKGASLGESLVSAIARLRETNTSIDISDEEVKRISEMPIIADSNNP